MSEKKIGVGCDHAGLALKRAIAARLQEDGYEVIDVGTLSEESCDYPDFAHDLAARIDAGVLPRGVLVCGTGVGMSMAANRHDGVRAVVCSEPLSARMARKHNDANVLCLGARVIGVDTAFEIVDAFLTAEFEGGRHQRRVDKINAG